MDFWSWRSTGMPSFQKLHPKYPQDCRWVLLPQFVGGRNGGHQAECLAVFCNENDNRKFGVAQVAQEHLLLHGQKAQQHRRTPTLSQYLEADVIE